MHGHTVAILVFVVKGVNKTRKRSYFCRIWNETGITADNAIDSIANSEHFTPGGVTTGFIHKSFTSLVLTVPEKTKRRSGEEEETVVLTNNEFTLRNWMCNKVYLHTQNLKNKLRLTSTIFRVSVRTAQ